jgi:aldose sugar dehydrogenase
VTPVLRLFTACGFAAILLVAGFAVACNGDANGTPGEEVPFDTFDLFTGVLPPGHRIETVTEGLHQPTSLVATPDGRLLIAEQITGLVRVFEDGELLDEPWIQLDVYYQPEGFLQELGLVGITVDPEFEDNGYVYLYYTDVDDEGERRTVLERYREVDGEPAEPQVILEIYRAPYNTHVAGSLAWDGDALLVGIGDHEDPEAAQDLSEPIGKILRIDRDGEPLPDNPFVDDPEADPRVFVYGVRNTFGIAVDPDAGRIFFTDNRTVAGDAVYELDPGTNYGWPHHRIALVEPMIIYEKPMGPAGAMVYTGDAMPELRGDMFFCSFHQGGMLHWSDTGELAGFEMARRDRVIAGGCTSGITQGADGFIYYVSYGHGAIVRIAR